MENRKLQLQPRLQMLADLVPAGAKLADVGTDHGYLPVWLLQEGRIRQAIASDINLEPLEHARRTAAEYGVSERMEFRLCAGLDKIRPDETDTIVIAGMGGETILSILESAPWSKKSGASLLLQPMTKAEMLRVWLTDNGYCFTGEHLVFDKNFLYPIFCVTGGAQEKLTEEEAFGGILLKEDPLYVRYLEQQIRKLQRRIEGLKRSDNPASRTEAEHLEDLRLRLEKRREEILCTQ